MISVQIDITREQIEDAMADMFESGAPEELLGMIISVIEQTGSPHFAKSLIGLLGDTYTQLEETFGE